MPIDNIFDAIQLSGTAPGIGDSLSTSGGDLVGISEPLAFNTATEGEIHPGDTVEIGGVTYTVSGVADYLVDATLQNGDVMSTKMYSISLTDPDGNTLDFLVNGDPEATETDGNLPQITQLEITGESALANGYVSVPLVDENNNVTLADNVNNDPIANDDISNTDEDTSVLINVLNNDTDLDGDDLSILGTPTALHGTVTVNADGTLVYTPDANYNGVDTISYEITDGNGGTDTAEVTVTIAPVNDAPVAVDDADTTPVDTPVVIDVLGNDTDPDGDALSIVGTPTSDDGSVVVNADGTITFTPNAGFTGEATINYEITDGNGGNDTAVVTVTVDDDANADPIANDDSDTTLVDTPVTVDVLSNDTDPEGDPLTILGTPTSADGTVVVNADGTLTFTPNAGFTGEATIDYEISDGNGGTDTAVVTITVTSTQDGIITGSDAGDLIDVNYDGDPDGDMVDNNDEILPGEGPNDDIILAGGGDDVVIAGLGDDDVYGGTGNDELTGNEGDDILRGEEGDDILDGGDGDDILEGGDGSDGLDGGDGDDQLYGGDGDDTIDGGDGSDTVDGGDGDDVIDTSGSDPRPDLGYPGLYTADDDPDDDRDTVYGGAGNDTITTGDDADVIFGGTGNDTIDGGIDDDIIDGGDGDDIIVGGEGSDIIDGGAGDDTIYAGLDPVFPDGLNIPDDPDDGSDPDLVTNNGMDVVHGGDGNDTIYGADDDDILYGDAGDDTIYGGVDDDTLYGGTGNDTLSGGQGDDTMIGGDDRDTFTDITAGDTVDGGSGGDDHDILDLSGLEPWRIVDRTDDADGNSTSGTIEFLDADGNVTGTMAFSEIEEIVCFVSGTRIKTTAGEIPVEDLEVGQLVQTMDHGLQPIRWIGSAKRPAVGDLAPIRIRKGALGNDRDLWVSPQHRMLMSGAQTEMMFGESEVLATAKSLLNDYTITRVEGGEVEYFHILFDSHEIIYAEGAPSESFHPGEQGWKALDQATRDEILELFPELASTGFEAYGPSARLSLKAHEAAILKTK